MAATAQTATAHQPQPFTGDSTAQLPLYKRPRTLRAPRQIHRPLCAGCREKEARYGFRHESDPAAARPRTLCFECFRVEIGRRQAVAAQLARGWNATQARLPLDERLEQLNTQRRRAQIAARHALGL